MIRLNNINKILFLTERMLLTIKLSASQIVLRAFKDSKTLQKNNSEEVEHHYHATIIKERIKMTLIE